MSVPLPSPSHLPTASTAKPIPRSRPQPIGPEAQASPSFARSPASPGSPRAGSLRNKTARSVGFGAGTSVTGASEDNWRERNGPKSAVRTVGGFEKKGLIDNSPGVTSPALGSSVKGDKEKEGEKTAALSHVPCRFFKAGACTAGNACPFSHEEGGKREVCQWFLKGNCKFGHKCALAHVRPGEPMSMDRKNKKAAQAEARDRDGKDGGSHGAEKEGSSFREGSLLARTAREGRPSRIDSHAGQGNSGAAPVPIRSALSSSLVSPPPHRIASSPMREPIGPPPLGPTGGSSPGFARSPIAPGAFASSPSRPSPLSASFNARSSIPGPLSLRSQTHSPLRPPSTAFSSSFSHSAVRDIRPNQTATPPLSASFADGMRKNIWARHESASDLPEVLSPRQNAPILSRQPTEDVFEGELEDDDHGEDLLPSSLSDLLTPRERARRLSRRDSNDSYSASPGRTAFLGWTNGGERLAQSAGPTMGPGFLQGLWSAEGADARKSNNGDVDPQSANPASRQSLLTQQRSPESPQVRIQSPLEGHAPQPFFPSRPIGDPSSPNSKALAEHAPGKSLPGGLANALSRLHLHGPKTSSGMVQTTSKTPREDEEDREKSNIEKRRDEQEEGLFAMDG